MRITWMVFNSGLHHRLHNFQSNSLVIIRRVKLIRAIYNHGWRVQYCFVAINPPFRR